MLVYSYTPSFLFPQIRSKNDSVNTFVRNAEKARKHAKEELIKQQELMIKKTKQRPYEFKVGQKVLVKGDEINTSRLSKKLEHRRFGPFEILKQTGPANFELKLYKPFNWLHNNFHADHPIHFHETDNPHCLKEPPPPVFLDEDDSEPEYEVNHISKSRNHPEGAKYLVHWEGYSDKEATWELLSKLVHSAELVLNYHLIHTQISL